LLDGLRRAVDEVLRLLQAEARDRADDLDHLDLLVAHRGEHDVERRLLLGGRGAVAACHRSGRNRHRCGGGDAPRVLDLLLELDELEDAHLAEALEDLVDAAGCCHDYSSSVVASAASGSEASLSSFVVSGSAEASASGSASAVGSSAVGSAG